MTSKKIENPNTKNIYQKVIHEGSKQHKIAGETLWKKLLPKLDFQQVRKNVYITRSTILHQPTLLTATLLNKSKQIHAQMHQRHKPEM